MSTYQRFQESSVPPVVSNAHIQSFALNELTQELLYVTNSQITLVSLATMAELRRIPFSSLVRSEPGRLTDRKFQELLQSYVAFGIHFLNSLPHLNIWLGIINKRRVICFSEDLEVSNEVTLDCSGVVGLHVHPTSGDLFVLGVEGKVYIMTCEYSFEAYRKRIVPIYDFEIRITVKKQIGPESLISKFALSTGTCTYLIAVSEVLSAPTEVHLWNFSTGEKMQSLLHSDVYGQSISIQAITAYNTIVALVDSNKTLVVYDFATREELVRSALGTKMGNVVSVLLEDSDITAGVYVLDSSGTISDFVPGLGFASVHHTSRSLDFDTPPPPRERMSIPKLTQQSSRSSPIAKFFTQWTGLKQLWLLVEGSLEIISLASIGRAVGLADIARVERRQDRVVFYSVAGDISLFDPGKEEVTLRIKDLATGLIDREHPEGLFIPALTAYIPELDFSVHISVTGLLKYYDIESDVASLNFYMQKKTITSACFIRQPNSETAFDSVFGTSIGEVLIVTYDQFTREVRMLRKYAAHDSVVLVMYLPWVQKVMSIGREGHIRFLTFPDYLWDTVVFKGFWNDCSASAICGNSVLLLGYESGMLQTLYLRFTNAHPAATLLEYHIFKVTSVCGLSNSNSEAVSGDSAGFIVLWNLDQGRACKVFSVLEQISAVLIFGSIKSDRLYVTLKHSCVSLSLKTKAQYSYLSKKEIKQWKDDRVKKRTEYKGRKIVKKPQRSSSMTCLEDILRTDDHGLTGSVSSLLRKVSAAKLIVEKDPLEPPCSKAPKDNIAKSEVKKMTDNWFKGYLTRPLNQILEEKKKERLQKTVSKVIRHFGAQLPTELAFSGRVVRKFSPALETERVVSHRHVKSRGDKEHALTERKKPRGSLSTRPTTSQLTMKDLFYDKIRLKTDPHFGQVQL